MSLHLLADIWQQHLHDRNRREGLQKLPLLLVEGRCFLFLKNCLFRKTGKLCDWEKHSAPFRNVYHAEFTHTMHLKMQDTLEQNDHSVSFWRFVSRLVWKMAKTTIAGPFAGAAQEQDARSAANLRMAIASTGRHLLVLLALKKAPKSPLKLKAPIKT